MIHIEFEGLLYRGSDASQPEEIWDYPRKRWAPFHGGRWEHPGQVIDEARAEALKVANPDAEHFLYYDDPPWRQPLSEAYLDSLMPAHLRETVARRRAELAKRRS